MSNLNWLDDKALVKRLLLTDCSDEMRFVLERFELCLEEMEDRINEETHDLRALVDDLQADVKDLQEQLDGE